MNNNNKTIWIVLALACLAGFSVLFYALYSAKKMPLDFVAASKAKKETQGEREQRIYGEAIMSGERSDCEKLKDESLKEKCLQSIHDVALYNQAAAQLNPSLCKDVIDPVKKADCLSVASSSVEHFKAEDPQHLAEVHSASHNGDAAINEYEDLIKKNPGKGEYLSSLSLLYAERGLQQQESGGNQTEYVNKAISLSEKALNMDPKSMEAMRSLAYAYEIKPDYDKAIEIYGKAIGLYPNNPLSYVGRGHTYDLKGDTKMALADFEKAATFDPKRQFGLIYANLCRLEMSPIKDYDKLVKDCETAASSHNDVMMQSDSLQILASLNYSVRKFDKAQEYLDKANGLTPENANLLVTYANFYLAKEDFAKAEEYANKAIALSPLKVNAYTALANAKKNQGDIKAAIDAAEKSLSLVEKDVSLLASNKKHSSQLIYAQLYDLYSLANNKAMMDKYKQLIDPSAVNPPKELTDQK